MRVVDTLFNDVKVIEFPYFTDNRGVFAETWSASFSKNFPEKPQWLQDSFSISKQKGTVRGLHFQTPPYHQIKLVRVVKGSIFDVVVDIRHGSRTFGKHFSMTLKAGDNRQLLIAPSYAHGFCTLEDNTEVFYKLSGIYNTECYFGIQWNDPELNIDWPISQQDAVISEKDKLLPPLAELPPVFS